MKDAFDQDVAVYACALNGYKQPQALMLLLYQLTLGIKFDVVVNLDGFNDVALHEPENASPGVHPSHPRAWYARVAPGRDAKLDSLIVDDHRMTRAKNWLARRCRFLPESVKDYALLLPEYLRGRAMHRLYLHIRGASGSGLGAVLTGPSVLEERRDDLYDQLVSIWSRSSFLMHQVCYANGIRYLHCLQPNQYVPGAKPLMTSAERQAVVRDDHPYRTGVINGYPKLMEAGERLRSEGVAFADLTRAFAEWSDHTYRDSCCHLNDFGHRILANDIASILRRNESSHRPGGQ